ncbi:MAG: AmmeMemoRadiSam system protein B [Patescibacteria group bacterium]
MITFAAITPHPPIMIPGIGSDEDRKKIKNTISAMKKLREELKEANPETLIVISPHAEMESQRFAINSASPLRGSFTNFGLDETYDFKNDFEAIDKIAYRANLSEIEINLHGSFLDHGALVPLYYLTKNIKPKIVHLAFSMLDMKTHFEYGKILSQMCCEGNKKIAIIASGDLSHRLTPDAPAGYSEKGKEFDEKLINLLKTAKTREILNFDENLVEEAGQCGLRSIAILLGALEGKYEFNLLSYEGPFGVGYMVASLKP